MAIRQRSASVHDRSGGTPRRQIAQAPAALNGRSKTAFGSPASLPNSAGRLPACRMKLEASLPLAPCVATTSGTRNRLHRQRAHSPDYSGVASPFSAGALRTRDLSSFEIRNGRPVDHAAQRVKTRAMARAIPRLLAGIPTHHAPQVRTHRRKGVQVSLLIAIRRGFFYSITQYGALIRLDLVHRLDGTGHHVIAKLRGDIGVFSNVIR